MQIDKNIWPKGDGRWRQLDEHTHKLVFSDKAYMELDTSDTAKPVVHLKDLIYDEIITSVSITNKPDTIEALLEHARQVMQDTCDNMGQIYTRLAVAISMAPKPAAASGGERHDDQNITQKG